MTLIQGTTEPFVIWQSSAEWAAVHSVPGREGPVSERTMKRYLAAGEIPGARKDHRGRWLIPSDSVHTPNVEEMVPWAMPVPAQELTLVERELEPLEIDDYPTFLTLTQAAKLLAPVTERAIANNPEYFGVIELTIDGSHGHSRKMVPLATIKRLRGIIG